MSLPPEVEVSYAIIIDSILAASDLNTISEKRIRKGLQQAVEYDITPQKASIKTLINARFDKFMAEKNTEPPTNGNITTIKDEPNGHPATIKEESAEPVQQTPPSESKVRHKRQSSDDELSDVPNTPSPKKKRKAEPKINDDAAFAARLQAEENIRARPTRGGANKKAVVIKKRKAPKKKTSEKVKAEDDSDVQDSTSDVVDKKVNKNSAFHKLLTLSTPLSALLEGEIQLSRPQTVKKIWEYIRERDLQDPNDKRQIRCDDAMRAVFKQDKVHMFTMNKILAQNLYNPEE